MVKVKPSKEQRKAIRDARKIIQEVFEMDGNEAETRRRVERIFGSVMGYDVLKHLSRERAVQGAGEVEHVDFTMQLEPGPDVQPIMMVELKRVGIELAKKHLKQVTSYAIDAGCEWILLTNGREWKVYHVEFDQPPKVEMLDAWNLLEDKTDELVGKFEILSYRSIKRGGLSKIWTRVKVLAPDTLLAAIVTEDSLRTIRRNLRKDTGILVNDEEAYRGISRLLNEAAAKAMSSIKVPQRVKRTRKAKTDKEEPTSEQEGTFPE
ncbi:MAG: hypothetical protein E3J71_10480 [Candidatus Stahlbacteria bacterium]|nr:MAG: hypothetical protein E3J71_10480 [Candidatus Stahlbacteria bacterium]